MTKTLPDYSEYLTPQRLRIEERIWETDPMKPAAAGLVRGVCNTYGCNSIVEFGCGTGHIPSMLPLYIGYTGIDKNPLCIANAMNRNPKGRAFQTCDIRDFVSTDFDLVCMFAFVKHFARHEWEELFVKMLSMGQFGVFNVPVSIKSYDDGVQFPHLWIEDQVLQRAIFDAGHRILSYPFGRVPETEIYVITENKARN